MAEKPGSTWRGRRKKEAAPLIGITIRGVRYRALDDRWRSQRNEVGHQEYSIPLVEFSKRPRQRKATNGGAKRSPGLQRVTASACSHHPERPSPCRRRGATHSPAHTITSAC